MEYWGVTNIMPIERVSRTRFKWKSLPWMQPEKIKAVWIYCQEGHLRYELELNETVQLTPEGSPTSRIPIKDDRMLMEIEQNMLTFEVSGAFGRGIIVGNLDLTIGDQKKKLIVLSDLKNWRDWLENKRNFNPRK